MAQLWSNPHREQKTQPGNQLSQLYIQHSQGCKRCLLAATHSRSFTKTLEPQCTHWQITCAKAGLGGNTKVRLVKAMVFPVVVYGCESWTVKKAERRRIDAFELWCWRRLLRVP